MFSVEEVGLNTDDSFVGEAVANSKDTKLSKKQKVSHRNKDVDSRSYCHSASDTTQSSEAGKFVLHS